MPSLNNVEKPENANNQVASNNEESSRELARGGSSPDKEEIYHPVEDNLQLVYWGHSPCLITLIGFGL